MITYPTIFFGAGNGPLKEDFEEYPVGLLPVYDQIWQFEHHQWLSPKNPNKYVGFTWKDYGVSGANDSFDDWDVGFVNISAGYDKFKGKGNFEIIPWEGFSAGFYRDSQGKFMSADQLRGYGYINFDWGNNAPINAYKSDFWSAKFISKLLLPLGGTYQLWIERDEAARVYVGRENGPSTLIFNQWGTTPPTGIDAIEPCIPFTFSAGEIDILIEFYEDTGPSKLKLYWSKPSTEGGGPSGPPVIITPDDFGNSGYVRIYTPTGPYSDEGQSMMGLDGTYRLGVSTADKVTEDRSASNIYMTGQYLVGIVYPDKLAEPAKNRIDYAGYYVVKNLAVQGTDSSKTTFDPRGFYAYRASHAFTQDQGKVGLNLRDSYYIPRYPVSRQSDLARVNQNMLGFYDVANVSPTGLGNTANSLIDPKGYYTPRYLVNSQSDFAYSQAKLDGNYFPIYVYDRQDDGGQTFLKPSGNYIYGYIYSDPTRNLGNTYVNAAGHSAYYMVTGDGKSDFAANRLGFDYGLYLFKNVFSREAEPARSLISYDGAYNPLRVPARYIETAKNRLDTFGFYGVRFATDREAEYARNSITNAGYYITGYIYCSGFDQSRTMVSPVGNYVTGNVPVRWSDLSRNVLSPQGNYFFAKEDVRVTDFAENFLGYYGEYLPIYINNPQRDHAYKKIFLDGYYSTRFVPAYGSDVGGVDLYPSGYYVSGYIYQPYREYSQTNLRPVGNYFFRYVSGGYLEATSGLLDMHGDYYYRFNLTRDLDIARNENNLYGYYANRYFTSQTTEAITGNIDMQGLYFGRYFMNRYQEPAFNTIGIDALYYNTKPPFLWGDSPYNRLNMAGELQYRFQGNRTQEPSFNVISITEGSYFGRYKYGIGLDYSRNQLILAGEYTKESWVVSDSTVIEIDFSSEFVSMREVKEYCSLKAGFSGVFVAGSLSSTLDYWLEIYQRPTYNMGKTQQYFSI